MTRDETVALFLQGREAWNAWAAEMLAGRNALEEAGNWRGSREYPWEPEEGENPETQAWLEKAIADFSRCFFLVRGAEGTKDATGKEKKDDPEDGPPVKSIELDGKAIDFSGFVFPGPAWFASATFSGEAWFKRAAFSGNASFELSIFSGAAWFGSATFSGNAMFTHATFSSLVSFGGPIPSADGQFDGATFSSYASFRGASFSGDAWFISTTFSGAAGFRGAAFSGAAGFGGATFSGTASFDSSNFSSAAQFGSATFSGDASFASAIISGHAKFKGTKFNGDVRFDSVSFESITRFDGATFAKSARFDSSTFGWTTLYTDASFRDEANFEGVKVERGFDLSGVVFKKLPAFSQSDFKQAPDLDSVIFPIPRFWRNGVPKKVPAYRAIRRMAIQGADYEREQMAFKGELRSRRWTQDKWWHIGTWLGLFYDGVADCGRSIVRPANVWLASIAAFAAFYWTQAAAGVEARCGEAGGAEVQALYLSLKNAMVIFAGTRDARVNQAYLCLYNGSAEQPHIPPSVTFVETLAQIPLSAALIFLFLLAVRNRFKIK
jgi:uncharacterized protein YjbI with pentapeptide repeats